MLKVPVYQLEESLFPSRAWRLDEAGKWRPQAIEILDGQVSENNYLQRTLYEEAPEFPLNVDLPAFPEVDYESNFSSPNWSQKETNLLWSLCEQFNLNFLIIHDRLNWALQSRTPKTVEEVKERFFEIQGKLTGDTFVYDKELDVQRRLVLESYHSRPLEQSMEEAFVVDYLEKLESNGQIALRLSERIETIKMLAGEQFTAGWPTLPELLKIASGKGVARLVDKSEKPKKKKKRSRPSTSATESGQKTLQSNNNTNSTTSTTAAAPLSSQKKTKTANSSSSSSAGNIYLSSTKVSPLRVGSARAVEKILSDFNLPLKPDLPTFPVIQKYDQLRAAIIRLIDSRKAAGLPPSKSLESSVSSVNVNL